MKATSVVLGSLLVVGVGVGVAVAMAKSKKKNERHANVYESGDQVGRYTFAVLQDGKVIYQETATYSNAIDAQAAADLWLTAHPLV